MCYYFIAFPHYSCSNYFCGYAFYTQFALLSALRFCCLGFNKTTKLLVMLHYWHFSTFMPTPHVCARRHTVRSGSTTDLGVLLPLPLPGRQRGHRRGIRGKANFQTSVVRSSYVRKGNSQFKDRYMSSVRQSPVRPKQCGARWRCEYRPQTCTIWACEKSIPDDSLRMAALLMGGSVTRAHDAFVRKVRDSFGGRCAVEQQQRRWQRRPHYQWGNKVSPWNASQV